MVVMFATLYQLNFCYLVRFIIISSVHGAFSLPINVHAQNIGTQEHLLRKSFDTGIVKKVRQFQYWAKKIFLVKKHVLPKEFSMLPLRNMTIVVETLHKLEPRLCTT